MSFGDIGGASIQLVITCRTPTKGKVSIEKGDALGLVGDYTVSNKSKIETHPIFGQALANADLNDAAIPVKVRGVCIFNYVGGGDPPIVGGRVSVAVTDGAVVRSNNPLHANTVLKVDAATQKVHVLI